MVFYSRKLYQDAKKSLITMNKSKKKNEKNSFEFSLYNNNI